MKLKLNKISLIVLSFLMCLTLMQSSFIIAKEDPITYEFNDKVNDATGKISIVLQMNTDANITIDTVSVNDSILTVTESENIWSVQNTIDKGTSCTYKITYHQKDAEENVQIMDITYEPKEFKEEIQDTFTNEIAETKSKKDFKTTESTKKVANKPTVKNLKVKTAGDESYFLFNESSNTITGYSASTLAPKDIIIPAKINNVDVLYIADNAFAGQQLTSVRFTEGILKIGKNAFSNNKSMINDLLIPDSVIGIGDGAFSNCGFSKAKLPKGMKDITTKSLFASCVNLASVQLPDDVKSLGDSMFWGCTSLKTFTMPDTVSTIGSALFYQCTNLTTIKLSKNLRELSSSMFSGCNSLLSIEIPETVTAIGNSAFSYCSKLTNIDIPDSVVSIGSSVFLGCTNLTSLEFPRNAKIIDGASSMFYNCKNLTTITIPEGIKRLGYGFFYGCTKLSTVNLPNSLEVIEGNSDFSSFNGCSNLKSITLPEGLTTIGNGAFASSYFETLRIPTTVTTIGNSAFENARLKSLIIPEGVTELGDTVFSSSSITKIEIQGNITQIKKSTFDFCGQLSEIVLPNTISSIGKWAFRSCYNLKTINFDGYITEIDSAAFDACDDIEIKLPNIYSDEITGAPWGAVRPSITWKDTIHVSDYLFSLRTGILGSYTGSDVDVMVPANVMYEGVTYPVKKIMNGTFSLRNEIQTLKFQEGIEVLGDYLIYKNTNVKMITLPDSIKEISNKAFQLYSSKVGLEIYIPTKEKNSILGAPWGGGFNCYVFWASTKNFYPFIYDAVSKSIVGYRGEGGAITIPASFEDETGKQYSVDAIENQIFYSNKAITSVSMENGIKEIGASAFSGASSLEQVTLPESITTIKDSAFWNCTALRSIKIPNEVRIIDGSTFWNCSNLEEVILPLELELINDTAFKNCVKLQNIKLPNSLKKIGYGGFLGCTSLQNITLPSGLTALGAYAFSECVSITDIVIPHSVTDLTYSSYGATNFDVEIFSECTNLQSVEILAELDVIPTQMFSNCVNLKTIKLPKSLSEIKYSAFENCSSLKEVILPNGITEISYGVFRGCTSLSKINIPEGVTSIDQSTFADCSSLTTISLPSTITKLSSDSFKNSGLKNIFVMMNRSSAPTSITNIQPWGATDAVVAYAGEFVTFQHSIMALPNYKRKINIRAYMDTGKISKVVLPDGTFINVGTGNWPSTDVHSYLVDHNGTYVFKGYDDSGNMYEYPVVIDDIGKPIITANDAIIDDSELPVFTKTDVYQRLNVKAVDEENNTVPYSISDAELEQIQKLKYGEEAFITITATSSTGLSAYKTVIISATGTRTATFHANEGIPAPDIQVLTPGDHVMKPSDPMRAGYIFKGWYMEKTFTTAWDFDVDTIGTENINLYAKWEKITYTIFVDDIVLSKSDALTISLTDIVLKMNVVVTASDTSATDISKVSISPEDLALIHSGQPGEHEITLDYDGQVQEKGKITILEDAPNVLITIPKDIVMTKVEGKTTFEAEATDKVAIAATTDLDFFHKNFVIKTAPVFKIINDESKESLLVQVFDALGNRHLNFNTPLATLNKTKKDSLFTLKAYKDLVKESGTFHGIMNFTISYGEDIK